MLAITLTNQKIWPLYMFLRTNKQTGQKLYAPNLSMRGHKKKNDMNTFTHEQTSIAHFDELGVSKTCYLFSSSMDSI